METIAMYFLEQIEPVVIVEPIDGDLQAFIDATNAAADAKFDAPSTFSYIAMHLGIGRELHELEEARLDEEWTRRGC